MALDTYTGLLSALAAFSVRGDQTALWPDCVSLAEAEFNRVLKVQPMQAMAEATLDGEYFTIPGDFKAVVAFELLDPVARLQSTSTGGIIRMKQREAAYRADIASALGVNTAPPAWYARVGSQFRVFPAPEDGNSWEAVLTYWAKFPALSVDNQTNWLLDEHPDLYLNAALVQFGKTTEDERLGAWAGDYKTALAQVLEAYPVETDKARLRTDLPLSRCY